MSVGELAEGATGGEAVAAGDAGGNEALAPDGGLEERSDNFAR